MRDRARNMTTRSQVGGKLLVLVAVVFAVLLGMGFGLSGSTAVNAQEVPTVPNLVISDITSDSAALEVEATSGCDIESITLEYRQGTSDPYISIASGACSDLIGNKYGLTGLTANTTYNVRVSASLAGSIISTDVVTPFTTDPIAQLLVQSVTVVARTSTTANITVGTNGGGSLLHYRYRSGTSGTWSGASFTTSVSRTVFLTGLTPSTAYEFQAVTTHSVATGIHSEWIRVGI